MHIGQSRSNALNVFFTNFLIPAEIFLEENIHNHQLCDLGGNGAQLEGAFVGAAPQNHICQFCGRGFWEPGDQNGFDAPCFGQFQYLQAVGGGTGVGKQQDDTAFFQSSRSRDLQMGVGCKLMARAAFCGRAWLLPSLVNPMWVSPVCSMPWPAMNE